jgi:MerR family transcriptional regulator/heat shock protein HspR
MTSSIIPREEVAEQFTVAPSVLVRYESRGLIRAVREGSLEGYSPKQIRRIWTILSLQRDLGINLAGVEAILRLRVQLEGLHHQLNQLADELRAVAETSDQLQAFAETSEEGQA